MKLHRFSLVLLSVGWLFKSIDSLCYKEHVLPTAHAFVSICTTLSTERFVILHASATSILIECVGARMSLVSKAHQIRELVYVHVHDVFSRCHNHTMVLSDDLRLSCRREP